LKGENSNATNDHKNKNGIYDKTSQIHNN